MAHVAGMPIADYCAVCGRCEGWRQAREEIVRQVRDSAYHIIGYKGSTCYGIGLALVRIVGAVLRDERSVLTVSSLMDGAYDIRGVCFSVPASWAPTASNRSSEALWPTMRRQRSTFADLLRQTLAALDTSAADAPAADAHEAPAQANGSLC
jgi:L-lactate dehydrogenase